MNYFLYAKFPPPINGQSLCAKHLIKSFYIATKNPIVPINRIIFTEKNIISKLLSEIVAFYKLLRSLNVRGQSILIISLASGLGAWFDVALLIVFSFCSNIKIYIWYHSRSKSQGNTYSQKLIDLLSRHSLFKYKLFHLVLDNPMLERRRICGIPDKNIIVLDNSYIFLDSKISSKQYPLPSIPLSNTCISFGYLSALSYEKGFPLFVDTVVSLSKKYTNLHFNCLIAGLDLSDGLLNEFLDYADSTENIKATYLGLIGDDKYDIFFPKIDFLLFPSCYQHEALPLTLIESIFSGVIPIATDIGGIRDLIENPFIENVLQNELFIESLDNILNIAVDHNQVLSYLQDRLRSRMDQSVTALNLI